MIYLIPFTFGIYLIPKIKEQTKFYMLFVSFLIVTLIRYGYGADYFPYAFIYKRLNMQSIYHLLTWQLQYEPFFKLLMAFFKLFNLDFTIVLSLYGAILFSLTSLWINRNSNNKGLALLLYISMFYFVWSISAFRQSTALVLALFLFFDKKEYSLRTQIISVTILGLFHYSAFYLFFLMPFNSRVFSKNQLLKFLIFTLVISILPLQGLIEILPQFPLKTKILSYFQTGLPFLKFGYLVRFVFMVILFIFYDIFSSTNKKYLDNIIFGFGIYFILSSSPLIAGRISIYSFILIVVLLADAIDNFKYSKIALLTSLVFALLFFIKETKTLVDQSGLEAISSFPTIFNKDDFTFDRYDYYLLKKEKTTDNDYNNFINSLDGKEYVGYDEDKHNFIAWNKLIHGYSIYNIDGDFSIEYNIRGNPRLYNDILVNEYDVESLYKETRYLDFSRKNRSTEEMIDQILLFQKNNIYLENKNEKLIDISFDELPVVTKELFEYPGNISYISIYEIEIPFKHFVVQAKYYYDTVYLYLDQNKEPLIDRFFSELSSFDSTFTMKVRVDAIKYHINYKGDILWIE